MCTALVVADISVYVSVPAARDHVALSLYDVDMERSVPPTPVVVVVVVGGTFLRRAVAEREERRPAAKARFTLQL